MKIMKWKFFIHAAFLIIFIFSCDKNINEPQNNELYDCYHSECETSISYLPLPRIYIPIDFEREMIGITIIDTILNYPPLNSDNTATFKTSSGDHENVPLGIIIGSFVDDKYFGFSVELPFIAENKVPIKNNDVLEINSQMDKISVSYSPNNSSKIFNYSIIYTDSLIYYPQRWFDRLP